MNLSSHFFNTTNTVTVNTVFEALALIPWKNELWLVSLIGFHIITSMCLIVLRNFTNLLLCVLFFLLGTVWCSDWINEIAANRWNLFATEQYFDSRGYFISCIWSIPAILNSLVITVLLISVSRESLEHKFISVYVFLLTLGVSETTLILSA
ncbi:unnamed protein product [Heterobilharzia americana]|nr:unnamed protein product [Heterobilharzia americana]